MIPKKIHYCWFGRNPKPKMAEKCIASWKKYCPDYEIIEWNEDNFDVNESEYTSFCFDRKMYAYLSDYVRLWAVKEYGGIYFDTDVELIKNIDALREYPAFICFEGDKFITTGLGFGAEQNYWAVNEMLKMYRKRTIAELQATINQGMSLTGSPKMNTYALIPFGLKQDGTRQNVRGMEILSSDYLCPFNDLTGELKVSDNTVSIHWYGKSANKRSAAIRSRLLRPIRRLIKFLGVKYR